MNVFIVYAHPEPQSLNGTMKDFYISYFEKKGHYVKVSNLYAMNWKASADGNDFLSQDTTKHLCYMESSGIAYANDTPTEDIKRRP